MSAPLRSVSIIGARGKMGRTLSRLIEGEFSARAQLRVEIHSSSDANQWFSAADSDVWVDFSLPAGIRGIHTALQLVKEKRTSFALPALVIGTTGHDLAERKLIEALSGETLVLQSANFSIGTLILKKALEFASPLLTVSGFRPVMIEKHHIHKKDAPSGTGLSLAQATQGLIPERIHSIRAGEIVGDHEVTFHGAGEQVGFYHHALSREIFARGALEVALWLAELKRRSDRPIGMISLESFFEEKLKWLTPSK